MSAGVPDTDIGYLLNRTARLFRLRLAEALADTGLTPQQSAVLLAIGRSADGMLTPSAIAESIDTDLATTSGLLERLTRGGWLQSEPNPDDGRSRLIGHSDKTREMLPTVLGAAEHVSSHATACLSKDEARVLRDLLARLCAGDVGGCPKEKVGKL